VAAVEPVQIAWESDRADEPEAVSESNPLPVQLPQPARGIVETALMYVAGIGAGAAYADLDAMGTTINVVNVPKAGKITGGRYFDRDDEGLRIDLWVFNRRPTTSQTDNGAFVVANKDLDACIGVIPFADFSDANTGQVSVQTGLDLDYVAPDGALYYWVQARGALNIAAGSEPTFRLTIRPDAGV